MNFKTFIFLAFLINFLFSFEYKYELIKEFIPKSSYLQLNESYSYKMYKYTPVCNQNINSKMIYLDFSDATMFLKRYIYDDYSKIQQDEHGKFKNFDEDYFYDYYDVSCSKDYYIVVAYYYEYSYSRIAYYQLTILNEDNDGLILSPSLSNNFNFFTSDNLFYSYDEDKIAIIYSRDAKRLNIYENDTLIYDGALEYTKYFKFLKNTNYNISFYGYSEDSTGLIQLFDDSQLIKHNFENESLILLEYYKYNIEIDISNYNIGNNIGFLIYGDSEFRFKYRFKQLEKEIDLGKFRLSKGFQYIIIKKDINDDSLLISIEKLDTIVFIGLDIIKYEIDEIKPENEIMEIKGPKLIYYDFYSFDMYISYGIYSDQSYFYINNNNKGTDKTEIVSIEHNNLSLIFHEKNGISLKNLIFLLFIMNLIIFFMDSMIIFNYVKGINLKMNYIFI